MFMPLSDTTDLDSRQLSAVEKSLVLTVLASSGVFYYLTADASIVFHLYYLPVILTGFYLGYYRARLMACLCIGMGWLLVHFGLGGLTQSVTEQNHFGFLSWAATMLLTATLAGKLSDSWRNALDSLKKSHLRDVLTDGLTGIANRRAYEFELSRCFAQWERNHTPLSLLMLDIDHFKQFNDRYGHAAGDAVLQGVAGVLQASLRKSDLIARYGGEEFGVILPGISHSELKDVAERTRHLIEMQRFSFEGLTLRVTASIGFAQALLGDDTVSLTKRADAAMYAAKEAGRNCVFLHDGTACRSASEGALPADQPCRSIAEHLPESEEAYSDQTTGLPTQQVYLMELKRRAAERTRYGTEAVVALVRVDSYATVPAHESRMQKCLVARIARLMSSQLRETDLVTRYSADTLAVLMPSTTLQSSWFPLQRALVKADRYEDAQYPGLSYSISIGATEIRPDEQPQTVIQNLERSLQEAVAAGGGCLVLDSCDSCPIQFHLPAATE
jgi:diguanylate cyclase (GGDEF)-like protein